MRFTRHLMHHIVGAQEIDAASFPGGWDKVAHRNSGISPWSGKIPRAVGNFHNFQAHSLASMSHNY